MNKKAATVTLIFISILAVLTLFFGMYNYIDFNYENANITERVGYNQSKADLEVAQTNLDDNIEDIKEAAQGISAADSNIALVAWNGLVGIAQTMRLFINVIDVGIAVWNALLPGLAFLPTWFKLLIEMALVIWVVLTIVGAFKGESKT